MDDGNWSKESLTIGSLNLWDENARFPDKYFKKTEQELVDYFLSKKDFKVADLAEEITSEIDIPQLERLVVVRKDDKNIVVEGNRRLTVYKLLANPNLIKDEALKTRFLQLAKRANVDENYSLDVLVASDMSEGVRVIERKHLKANNEISWGDSERAHYSARKGEADRATLLKVAIAKEVKRTGLDEAIIDQILGRGFVTTFQRIMAGSAAGEVFGYKLDDRGNLIVDDPKFLEKLKVVILNVLQKKSYDGSDINSRSLNKNPQIKEYLSNIDTNQIEAATTIIKESRSENLLGEQIVNIPTTSGKRSVPRSTSRKYLIPRSCILQIDGQAKINNIYHELRDTILLDDSNNASPNAAGMLFRVFLETSLDCYLERHGLTVKQDDTISSKIPQVIAKLKAEGATDAQMTNINKVASSKPERSILSIVNFHQYVHSHKTQPQPTDLKNSWDDLQEFFEVLWGSLHKQYTAKKLKK